MEERPPQKNNNDPGSRLNDPATRNIVPTVDIIHHKYSSPIPYHSQQLQAKLNRGQVFFNKNEEEDRGGKNIRLISRIVVSSRKIFYRSVNQAYKSNAIILRFKKHLIMNTIFFSHYYYINPKVTNCYKFHPQVTKQQMQFIQNEIPSPTRILINLFPPIFWNCCFLCRCGNVAPRTWLTSVIMLGEHLGRADPQLISIIFLLALRPSELN